MNPFVRKKPNPKRREPRRTVEERLHGQAKTDRRREIFERSHGACEAQVLRQDNGFSVMQRCNAPITFETMEWSHNAHGAHKSDSLDGGIASCKECHRKVHNPKACKRRPGKPMIKKHAEAYWNGAECFCEKEPKRPRESFGPECRGKVSPVTLHTLENTDDPEVYRETLAQAEIEILKRSIERPSGAGKAESS